jgi:hypothetical protein
MLGLISRGAGRWIRRQQRIFHPRGRGLTPDEREVFRGFFDSGLLARVRLHRLDRRQTLTSLLAAPAFFIPFELRNLAGITFGDAIVLAERAPAGGLDWQRLVFHELVHVVQYELLGIDRFIHRYLTGWARAGFRYLDIPLERDARALEARFNPSRVDVVSVRAAVEQQLGRSSSPE